MAVLLEAISVVVRMDAINVKYKGGWEAFRNAAPNRTLCNDRDLARVGFMVANDVREFVYDLETQGLVHLKDGTSVDCVVVDQLRGPTTFCSWIELGNIQSNSDRIVVCRRKGTKTWKLFAPDGWKYDGSLSQTYGFTLGDAGDKALKFLRHEDGVDVYLSQLTGLEVFVGRTSRDNDQSKKT